MTLNEINKKNLEKAVAEELKAGFEIQSQTEDSVILEKTYPINYFIHFLISLFTCGTWAIMLVLVPSTNSRKFIVRLSLDEKGHVIKKPLKLRSKAKLEF
jgi:hypothetical protein